MIFKGYVGVGVGFWVWGKMVIRNIIGEIDGIGIWKGV